MINWVPLSSIEEEQKKLEENDYLIYTDRQDVRYVTYDAIYNNFFYATGFQTVGIHASHVTHYAEINLPDTNERMIDWCEHGNMLICDVCTKGERE